MPALCFTIRFVQPFFHARRENDEPEWPPSPLRLFQALVASSAGRWNERTRLTHSAPALRWLEALRPPRIVAAGGIPFARPYRLYVPDNVGDLVAAAWARGRDEASIADHRAEKDVVPIALEGESVHYLYQVAEPQEAWLQHMSVLTEAARSITHVGWGIDLAFGDAALVNSDDASRLAGHCWNPSSDGGMMLRVAKPGTLDDVIRKHADFLGRMDGDGFRPVPPLRAFDIVRYRRRDKPTGRLFRIFELRNSDGSRFAYPQRRLIHIAGMVRHLAIQAMKDRANRPPGATADWVETYVAGHRRGREDDAVPHADAESRKAPSLSGTGTEGAGHRQLSYVPLPSIGPHADPGIRRVMIVAPPGDDGLLAHLARRITGHALRPLRGDEFGFTADRGPIPPPILVLLSSGDGVTSRYTRDANVWHTFTPVILPGHDDHDPRKTKRLIERTLAQSGIDQPCEFEWSMVSRVPNAYSAHKSDRDGRPQGYFRPQYLLSQTAVHLTLRFANGIRVPGPLVIGSGRHCGFGLMAAGD